MKAASRADPYYKRASASRPSGQWKDGNYDVLGDGAVVGRIFLSPAGPQDRPWMWASGHNGDIRRAAHGYEPTRERQWRRSPELAAGIDPEPAAADSGEAMKCACINDCLQARP